MGSHAASWLRTTPKNSALSLTSVTYSTSIPVWRSNCCSVGKIVTRSPLRFTLASSM